MTDAQKLTEIKIFCSSETEPVLTNEELNLLVTVYTNSGRQVALRKGWEIKLGKCASQYNFSNSGDSFSREAVFTHCEKMMKLYGKGAPMSISKTKEQTDKTNLIGANTVPTQLATDVEDFRLC